MSNRNDITVIKTSEKHLSAIVLVMTLELLVPQVKLGHCKLHSVIGGYIYKRV